MRGGSCFSFAARGCRSALARLVPGQAGQGRQIARSGQPIRSKLGRE